MARIIRPLGLGIGGGGVPAMAGEPWLDKRGLMAIALVVAFMLTMACVDALRPGTSKVISGTVRGPYNSTYQLVTTTTLAAAPRSYLVGPDALAALDLLRPTMESWGAQGGWWQGVYDCKQALGLPLPKFRPGPAASTQSAQEGLMLPKSSGEYALPLYGYSFRLDPSNLTIYVRPNASFNRSGYNFSAPREPPKWWFVNSRDNRSVRNASLNCTQ